MTTKETRIKQTASERLRSIYGVLNHLDEQHERAEREQQRFMSLHQHTGWWPRKARQCKREKIRLGYLVEAYEVLGKRKS